MDKLRFFVLGSDWEVSARQIQKDPFCASIWFQYKHNRAYGTSLVVDNAAQMVELGKALIALGELAGSEGW